MRLLSGQNKKRCLAHPERPIGRNAVKTIGDYLLSPLVVMDFNGGVLMGIACAPAHAEPDSWRRE
jgi:hypothetical protein